MIISTSFFISDENASKIKKLLDAGISIEDIAENYSVLKLF